MVKIKYRKPKESRRVVDAIVSWGSTRVEVSTGVKLPDGVVFVQPKSFAGGTGNQRADLDAKLSEWENSIRKKFTEMVTVFGMQIPADSFKMAMKTTSAISRGDENDSSESTLLDFLNSYYKKASEGLITSSRGLRLSSGSLKVVKFIIPIVEEFVIKYGDFDFRKHSQDNEKLMGRATILKAYDEYFERLKMFYLERGAKSTAKVRIAAVKSIILRMAEMNGIPIHSRYLLRLKLSFRIPDLPVTLSIEQYEWMIKNEDKIRKETNRANSSALVDYIYASLLTGARYSDVTSWKKDNLIEMDGQLALSYVPAKTKNSSGVKVEVPVIPALAAIFKKHEGNRTGNLLPYIATVSLAKGLRRILSAYELFHNVVQYYEGNGELRSGRLCDVIVYHSLRGSMISYLLNTGEQESVIKSISGHTMDSHSFRAYASVQAQSKTRAMLRLSMPS